MDLSEISTPRDWPKHAREFVNLEQLLRCEICFNFFASCMMTPCAHNFCSLCIRKHLSHKTSCPICFKEAYETELRNNRLIDEVITVFYNARSSLIEIMKGSFLDQDEYTKQSAGDKSSQETKQLPGKHTVKKEPEDPDDSVLLSSPHSKAYSTGKKPGLRSKVHCLPKRQYLPKKVYSLMKEKEIREYLKRAGLSVKGKREDLIRRYKQYITLYNAECDAKNPRQISELIKEIEADENARQTLSSKPQRKFTTNRNSNPDDIENERRQYVQTYSGDYQKLIAEIRTRNTYCGAVMPSSSMPGSAPSKRKPAVSEAPGPSTSATGQDQVVELSSDSDSGSIVLDNHTSNPHSDSDSSTAELIKFTMDETLPIGDSKLPSLSTRSLSPTSDNDSDKTVLIGDSKLPTRSTRSSSSNSDSGSDKMLPIDQFRAHIPTLSRQVKNEIIIDSSSDESEPRTLRHQLPTLSRQVKKETIIDSSSDESDPRTARHQLLTLSRRDVPYNNGNRPTSPVLKRSTSRRQGSSHSTDHCPASINSATVRRDGLRKRSLPPPQQEAKRATPDCSVPVLRKAR